MDHSEHCDFHETNQEKNGKYHAIFLGEIPETAGLLIADGRVASRRCRGKEAETCYCLRIRKFGLHKINMI